MKPEPTNFFLTVYKLIWCRLPLFLLDISMQTPNNNQSPRFNIRVYGICINDGHLLLSDEIFNGIRMTKFPGGGLHFGEGTIECLKREALEEFNCHIEILQHFYTTDYFQPAMFFENTQLISIYYTISIPGLPALPTSETPIFNEAKSTQHLRWMPIVKMQPDNLTFPIDRKVAEMIVEQYNG